MTARPLSILHFSTSDTVGGSARSAYRIHAGLRARGHRSRMLVGHRRSNDADVASVAGGNVMHFADRCANKIGGKLGFQYEYIPSSARVARHPWIREADVIQLFNTHGGYFAQWLLPELARHAPLVWRLSDLWALTGHCAYPGDCPGWMSGCHACPDLAIYPAIGIDRAAHLFREKARLYAGLPMTIVAPSSWIEQKARQSPLLGGFPIHRIPNGLDGRAYVPRSRQEARQRLGLPLHARVILFSAHILDDNPRKGGAVLMQALTMLGPQKDWILALMGEGGRSWRAPIPVHNLEFQSDPLDIASCYAAADVVAIPSVLENLPNTLIESLACGRVVVASDCGGMRDGVLHETTGLLTRTGDAQDLAQGLKRMLEADDRRPAMERTARALFEREFSAERELERFESLYFSFAARAGARSNEH